MEPSLVRVGCAANLSHCLCGSWLHVMSRFTPLPDSATDQVPISPRFQPSPEVGVTQQILVVRISRFALLPAGQV